MQVGIRELKAHLSEYVRLAEGGETVLVTDRGRVAAVLAPAPGRHQIEAGIRDGWITPAAERAPLAAISPLRSSVGIASAVAEDRGEA